MATATKTKAIAKPETCRLTLTIGHKSYAVRRLKADRTEFGVVRAVRLRRTDNSETYTVARTLDGFTCECGDATFRHTEGNANCKHVRAARAWGLI